jgi:hypothetical protein
MKSRAAFYFSRTVFFFFFAIDRMDISYMQLAALQINKQVILFL